MQFSVCVSSPGGRASALRCAGALTPYSVETVGEHAIMAGPGARVHVVVPAGTSEATVSWVRERLVNACKDRAQVFVRRGVLPA